MSLANFQHGSASGIAKEEAKEEKRLCIPRSSSPARAADEEDFLDLRRDGVITRSAAKRKTFYERETTSKEVSYSKQSANEKDVQVTDGNQDQPVVKAGKRLRLLGASKPYTKSKTNTKRASSPENYSGPQEDYYGAVAQSSDILSSDPIFHTEDEIFHVFSHKNSKSRAKKTSHKYYQPPILMLGADELEKVAYYLETKTAVNLLLTCKAINQKLTCCPGFWHQLCKNENFHEYSALKLEDKEICINKSKPSSNAVKFDDVLSEADSQLSCRIPTKKDKCVTVKTIVTKEKNDKFFNLAHTPSERLSWSGENFHDVKIPDQATLWRKIYLRGLQMRRNICEGRFELWRLFLTDESHLPVKKMTSKTTFRELRSEHRGSIFNRPERRVRIHRYWNEDYFIAIQQGFAELGSFHDVFVWRWEECQNPRYLYSYNLQKEYPTGLFPTAFFLWQSYLVLMPDTRHSRESQRLKSMIRVHDLSNEKRMKLVGSYDFPDASPLRRYVPGINAIGSGANETAHLHKLGDLAVALCRTPCHTIFIFSLPNCELVHEMKLCDFGSIERPLEEDDLDQRFLMRNNTMMFMFHHPQFWGEEFDDDGHVILHPNTVMRYGRLVFVDFTGFLLSQAASKKNTASVDQLYKRLTNGSILNNCKSQTNLPPISIKIDHQFDCNSDYIEKISVISKDRMVCLMSSGKIVVRDICPNTNISSQCSHTNRLSIPCPQGLKLPDGSGNSNDPDDIDTDDNDEEDIDGPTMCTSRDGDIVMVMRHFKSGRKIHAYETLNEGRLLYEINIDADSSLRLTSTPGYVSVDMDGNFVCAADLDKIVVWNSKNGKLIKVIPIVSHYNSRDDPQEALDRYCWKGHTDFAFAEDGIIIVHSQRNFPVAADIILFW